jgi:nucleoside diphosphate kinase
VFKRYLPSLLKRVKCKVFFPSLSMPAATKQKTIGKVVHYYDQLGVAIVELRSIVKTGDTVLFRRGEQEFTQTVGSLQVDHKDFDKAKKGMIVGIKVDEPVKEGAVMLAA